MGLLSNTIHFKEGIPDVLKIKEQFREQTGIDIWISAELVLSRLESYVQINQDLQKDIDQVISLEKERQDTFQKYPTGYSKKEFDQIISLKKEEHDIFEMFPTAYKKQIHINDKLRSLNHISMLRFSCIFYDIDLQIIGTDFTLECDINRFYVYESLIKVLVDLGGQLDTDIPRRSWKKLKPWDEYKWYNRPRI
jgi:hypothetical protein